MSATNSVAVVAPNRCLLEARDVFYNFGETPALRGANLSVARGEVLAIMGPSGSGKSTLLYCLAGILVPARGEIHFADRRIDTMPEEERSALRRDRFGFVFQFGQLVPELSAVENVAFPLLLGGDEPRLCPKPVPGSSASASVAWRGAARASSRAGRPNAWPSPAVWSTTLRSSLPTNPPDRSTR